MSLGELKPQALWNHFESLTRIPRPSKHEEKVGRYLADYGRSLKLETIVDEVGNVIIRKPATAGMENRRSVCLQSHMDMVPQKNPDVNHDFQKDPIRARVDGDKVRATGTTLGADNGIGMAAMLAVLESKELRHGPIETLFTVNEEAGMTGAKNLKSGLLKSELMLNLDSEDENELCVGCAGALDTTITVPAPRENLPAGMQCVDLKVTGLKGGHSGVDIGLGRANSNLLMARILFDAPASCDLRVVSIDGGDLRNAIPRETHAIIAVKSGSADTFLAHAEAYAATIREEFKAVDPGIRLEFAATAATPKPIRAKESRALIAGLFACPNGAYFMTDGMPDLVETSSNIGVVKTEDEHVTIIALQRSSVDTRKVELAHKIRSVFELGGAKVEHANGYSGWNPNMKSPLLGLLTEVYTRKNGRKPDIKATHGGLECGIIMGAYPRLDAVSLGPTIHFPHSPDEHVMIDSVARFWDFFVEVLASVPAR